MSSSPIRGRVTRIPAVRWAARNAIHAIDSVLVGSKGQRLEDTLVIVGTPRSGTTLVMELLAWLPGYTALFEPFHPVWFAGCRGAGVTEKPYLRAGEPWPEVEHYLERVFTGREIGKHYYFDTTPENVLQRVRSRRLVVKFVRANQLLPWMTPRFEVRGRVFVVRHPGAVIASQLKSGFTGYLRDGLDHTPTPEDLRAEATRLEPDHPGTLERIGDLRTTEEVLAAIWCLDMLVPAASPELDRWYLLPYERLVKRQGAELSDLFGWLGEPVPSRALSQLERPTQVARDKEAGRITDSTRQLPKWRKQLDDGTVRRILDVLGRFEIDFYDESPEPHEDRLRAYLDRRRSASPSE